ncbi:MAG: bifunctional folylpolyglutamate synthase/dihydrofolate synthase [Chloroflexi bacterium]|nr:bifunctional folylpolyglutamate synthase/dihydrofolate synthase [Chloroflexota bacterium]
MKNYLGSLPDLGARPQQEIGLAEFTLERMEILMEGLGQAERQYPSLHIAGTNGKGSVAAFCAAVLQAQGYRVGCFTSPHLAGALAGITIDQLQIEDADLEETFQVMQPHLEQRQDWTQFEVVTGLAFFHFARANVDAAVIEVGLGGRLDATNVLTPLVSVITPIDYDHTSILGTTLAEIAAEKAGIIKEGVPVVISSQPEEARTSILRVAKEKRAQVIEVGRDFRFERISSDLDGQVFEVTSPPTPLLGKERGALENKTRLTIALLGKHQIENAATAFAALKMANQRGLAVSEAAIERGFAAALWPGRFEIVRDDPRVILDAAHTPAAAQALRAALDEYFPGQPVMMVLGVSADKDLKGIVEPLRSRIVGAIATRSSHPRAMPAEELQGKLSHLAVRSETEPDAKRALEKVLGMAQEQTVILVCGSVFLVELIRKALTETGESHP